MNTKEGKQQEYLDDFFGAEEPEELEEEESGQQEPPEEKPNNPEEGKEGKKEEGKEEEEISPEEELESLFTGSQGEEEEEEEEKPKEKKEGEEIEEEDFSLELSEEDFEKAVSSHEEFIKYSNKIKKAALKEARDEFAQELAKAKEEILMNIPDVVSKTTSRQQNIKTLTSEFYSNYPQLKEKRAYVREMTNVVHSQNPEWSAKEVLEEVAKRAQRDLNISAEAEKREKQRKPKFAGTGGRRSPSGGTDTRSKQEKLLDDTFSK